MLGPKPISTQSVTAIVRQLLHTYEVISTHVKEELAKMLKDRPVATGIIHHYKMYNSKCVYCK